MRAMCVVVIAILLGAGCGSGPDEGATEAVPTSSSTEAVTTTAPSTTTSGAPTLAVEGPWDLVFFSDSSGWGIAELWANRISEELGVDVRVHDQATGSLAATALLSRLDSNDSTLRDLVAEAEIVVINGNPRGSGATDDVEACVSVTGPAPTAYSAADFAPYREVLGQLYDRVAELRAGAPTAIRAMDLYNPMVPSWELHGIENECAQAWAAFIAAVHEAAAANGVPVAAVAEAFNGPGFDQNPSASGLLGPDEVHTNDAGKAVIVDLLDELGYAPLVR